MEVNYIILRSMNVFEEKVVMTVIELKFVCQTSSIVFFFFLRSVHELFFMLSLIDRCQIVIDTCK